MNKQPDIIDVILRESSLVLSDQLINKLSVSSGDRISIGYIKLDDKLIPVISKSDSGLILHKNNSIFFRGKQREVLEQLGTNFWAEEKDGLIVLKGDGIPVYTSVKQAVEHFITKEIIEDRNYNITKLEKYEF